VQGELGNGLPAKKPWWVRHVALGEVCSGCTPKVVTARMDKPGQNLGWRQKPCSDENMDIFYAVTFIMLGNGHKIPFWHTPWLEGKKPIDITSLIFAKSNRKNWKVKDALKDDAWVNKVDLGADFSMEH
jgi:hypothetical protein